VRRAFLGQDVRVWRTF